jgi:hypothetical protein
MLFDIVEMITCRALVGMLLRIRSKMWNYPSYVNYTLHFHYKPLLNKQPTLTKYDHHLYVYIESLPLSQSEWVRNT